MFLPTFGIYWVNLGMAGPPKAENQRKNKLPRHFYVLSLHFYILVGSLFLFQAVAGDGWVPHLINKSDPQKLLNLYEQNSLAIFCSYNASPTAVVSWSRRGSIIPLDSRITQETIYQRSKTITVDSLLISKLQQSDAGQYTCTAKNSKGTDAGTLIVSLISAYKPIFRRPFPDVVLHVGEQYEQLCSADAYPVASYSWGKIGDFIDGVQTKALPDGRLIFSSAAIQRDNGVFRCLARNTAGVGYADMKVTVVPDPSWLALSPNVIQLNSSQTLWVNASFTASRGVVQVTWYKDKYEELEGKLEYPKRDAMDHFLASLMIANSNSKDSGNYTVKVSNSVGSIERTVPVVITGPPVVAIDSVMTKYVDTLHGSSLDCSAWGHPLPNITWYNEESSVDFAHPHMMMSGPRSIADIKVSLSYTAFTKGRFTCVAKNSMGESSAVVFLHARAVAGPGGKDKPTSMKQSYIFIIIVSLIVLLIVICIVLLLVWLKRRKAAASQQYHRSDNGFTDFMAETEDDDDASDYLVPLCTFGGHQSSTAATPSGSNRSSQRFSVDHKISSLPKHAHLDLQNGGIHADAAAVPQSNITIGDVLGQRDFTVVCLGHFVKEGDEEEKEVAVKKLKDGYSSEDRECILHELAIMQSLSHHPNIINLLGWCITDENIYILEDYTPNGNLLHMLRSYRRLLKFGNDLDNEYGTLDQSDLLSFAWQIANGMKHLASMKVVHKNLAARNILIGHERVCKVGYVGLAKTIDKHHTHQKVSTGDLPLRWMAYESIFQGKYSHESDMWSFGVLMWEMITLGEYPYPGIPDNDTLLKRLQTCFRMDKPSHCSNQLFDVLGTCWAQEPSHRATFKELCTTLGSLLCENSEVHINLPSLAESFKMDISYVAEDDTTLFNKQPSQQELEDEPSSILTMKP